MELNVALEAIKNKYKDLGLGDKILTGFASKIAKTATEETLAQLVEDIEPELQIWQSVLDSHRKEISDLKKQVKPAEAKKEMKPKEAVTEPETPKDEAPEWAKALISEVQGLKKQKISSELISQFTEKAKAINDERMRTEKIKAFEELVNYIPIEEASAKISALDEFIPDFNQSQANENLKGNPPMSGFGGKAKPSEAEVNEIVDNMKF